MENQNRVESLENELEDLERELMYVEGIKEEFLPEYGYSSKDEIIVLIKEDIASVEEELSKLSSYDYTEKELEEERSFLCRLQGLSRFC